MLQSILYLLHIILKGCFTYYKNTVGINRQASVYSLLLVTVAIRFVFALEPGHCDGQTALETGK